MTYTRQLINTANFGIFNHSSFKKVISQLVAPATQKKKIGVLLTGGKPMAFSTPTRCATTKLQETHGSYAICM